MLSYNTQVTFLLRNSTSPSAALQLLLKLIQRRPPPKKINVELKTKYVMRLFSHSLLLIPKVICHTGLRSILLQSKLKG